MTVFRYVGIDADVGLHCFQDRRDPKGLLWFNHWQIERGDIKPFCLDDALIRAATGMKE